MKSLKGGVELDGLRKEIQQLDAQRGVTQAVLDKMIADLSLDVRL